MTQADVAERREQGVKQEYQYSIYPLLEQHGYPVVALEPDEPTFSELVDLQRSAIKDLLDALCEVKHAFQEKILGPRERDFWGAWNQHFLDKIVQAASDYAGRRIVVIVGFEHSYWLRKRLAQVSAIRLLDIWT